MRCEVRSPRWLVLESPAGAPAHGVRALQRRSRMLSIRRTVQPTAPLKAAHSIRSRVVLVPECPVYAPRPSQPSALNSRLAFTLIEVVISSALMALILTSAYVCLHAGLSSQKMIEPRADIIQNARVALALMTADLRNACPLSKDSDFIGMHRMVGDADADNLDFGTHHYSPRRAREGDFCEISYFVDKDPQTGRMSLWRRRDPTLALDPLSGGHREEIAKGIAGVRFEYSDGLDWYSTWGNASGRGKEQSSQRDQPNLSGLPEAVRITLALDSNPKSTAVPSEERSPEPPFIFQTVARLELAAKVRNAASSTSQNGSGSPGESPQPGGAN